MIKDSTDNYYFLHGLKEDEVRCDACGGSGFENDLSNKSTDGLLYGKTCPKCHGDGKLDWIEHALGGKSKRVENFTITFDNSFVNCIAEANEEIFKGMSESLSLTIDKEIIKSYTNQLGLEGDFSYGTKTRDDEV